MNTCDVLLSSKEKTMKNLFPKENYIRNYFHEIDANIFLTFYYIPKAIL